MANPWERQETDTQASFEAFQLYRDLGPTRSIGKVSEKCNKAESLLYRWSSKHDWVNRVAAYDQYMDQVRLEEEEEARRIMNKEHAALAKLMLQKIKMRLETLDPEELSPHDVQKWLDTGTKVERQARGESPDNQQDEKVIVEIIDNMHELEE